MKVKLKISNLILIISLVLLVVSCKAFEDSLTVDTKGTSLNMAGDWQIVKASRNGVEITSLVGFDRFKLHLDEDGVYSIENYLPFVVKNTTGKWEIDDPEFPFRLFFYDMDGSNKIVANLNYPITEGKRQIILSFFTGCSTNKYSYVFERVITN